MKKVETDQYLDMFLDESREHLQTMNDGLLQLEQAPNELGVVQEIFRGAHTLKGMSATMGFADMAELTHKLENVLDAVRNEELAVTTEVIDILLKGADELEFMTEDIAGGGDGKRDVNEVVAKLKNLLEGDENPTAEIQSNNGGQPTFNEFEKTVLKQSAEQGFSAYQIRVVIREDCMMKAVRAFMVFEVLEAAGEVIQAVPPVDKIEEEAFETEFSVVLVSQEKAEEIQGKILKISEIESVDFQEIKEEFKENKKTAADSKPAAAGKKQRSAGERQASKTIRVNIDRLDQLMNLFEELVIDRGRLERISRQTENADLNETVERMSRVSSNMQEMILSLRMVPIDQVFGRFPKMVRDLSRDLNKKIQLQITGEDTELDRTVVDEIGDPLVHLLRNSLDHGIETPQERRKAGKPDEGIIDLKAFYSGNHVLIEIRDDGAGINRDGVLKKALENGVVSEAEADKMSDQQVYELLFASGFSTAETISDISGRGVGLDVVKNKIESLGGSVEVESESGKGTVFTIQLPLTLSIIASMLIHSNDEIYAVPLSSIVEISLVEKKQIVKPHGHPMMDYRGTMIPILSLREVFASPTWEEEPESYSVVLIRKGDKLAGLIVDDFIGHQEIVLKSLGNYFTQIPGISGATILGDGKVALVIDCNTLIR